MNDKSLSRRIGDAGTVYVVPKEQADYVPRTIGTPATPKEDGNGKQQEKK